MILATIFTSTAFLLGLTLASGIQKRESRCYGDLGCFQTSHGLSILPQAPSHVRTEWDLYTRSSRSKATNFNASDASNWSQKLSSGHFAKDKPTKILVHGFLDSKGSWMIAIKNALLDKGDFNVFLVDWSHGNQFPFTQASANVFLVAAQLAKFLKYLQSDLHVNMHNVHLIGHSLGAHVCGIAGSQAKTVGRISGMDPAEPIFDDLDATRRLDKSDAAFVDVIHTDGEKFTGLAGYGSMRPSGHIDFYPNGGQNQPGCTDNPIGGILTGILHGNINQAGSAVSCSHSRSHDYFLESIKSSSCKFTAHSCQSWASFENGQCHGCPSGGCPIMGYDADKTNARGSFWLSTTESSPFCGHAYFVEIDISGQAENTYGRLFITLIGKQGSSDQLEFTRENRAYHKNDKEKHVIAINKNLGDVTSVIIKFERGGGLSAAGTAKEIVVHQVVVQDLVSSHRTKFCAHDDHIQDDSSEQLSTHSGC